jgi:hypothetical protein
MCETTLNELVAKITDNNPTMMNVNDNKMMPFFEALVKTSHDTFNSELSDCYSVQLPDEKQVYYITEIDRKDCMGVVVEQFTFTHPDHVLLIVEALRKQSLFNELCLSCMRVPCSSASFIATTTTTADILPNSQPFESENRNVIRILETCLIEPFVLSIVMQHPLLLCYTTSRILNLKLIIRCPADYFFKMTITF